MSNLPSKTIALMLDKNYKTAIKNAVGSRLFRNLYVKVDGKETDIVNNGELSCAYFVSSILYPLKLIGGVHATVTGTVKDLRNSGWIETEELKDGCVLVWEKFDFGGGNFHQHIGFYIGNNRAISNDYKTGLPAEHDWKYNGERKIELILWNPALKASGN